MYIKRYTVSVILFMVLIGWYVYAFVTQESTSMDIFGIHLPALPIAFWVLIPVLLIYIASVAHMSYYSLVASLKLRKYQKDFDKLTDAITDAYLGKKNRSHDYKTARYGLIGKLVDNSTIIPHETLEKVGNDKLDTVLGLIKEINDGNVQELKKYRLDKDSLIVAKNESNRFEKGELSPEDVLSHNERYNEELCSRAYVVMASRAPLYAIEKYKFYMSKEALFTLLKRVNADENTLEISNESLYSLFDEVELTEEDYIKISSIFSMNMVPDQRLKLFETLSDKHEDAMPAYLYTLFDLEMIAPADEILENSQPDEYVYFKAYRALKECNKNFDINLFAQRSCG